MPEGESTQSRVLGCVVQIHIFICQALFAKRLLVSRHRPQPSAIVLTVVSPIVSFLKLSEMRIKAIVWIAEDGV